MNKRTRIVIIFLLLTSIIYGQSVSSGLSSTPQFLIPVGQKADLYNYGIGMNFEGLFSFGSIDFLSAGVDAGYVFMPFNLGQPYFSTDTNLSLINLGLSLRGGVDLGNRFSIFAKLGAGGSYGVTTGALSGNAMGFTWNTGAGIGLLLSDNLAMQTAISYVSYVGLYEGLSINIGINTRFSGTGSTLIPREDFVPRQPGSLPGGGSIQFMDVKVSKVFPVLYKYYATHPIGTATVVNSSKNQLENIEIRLAMEQYMDAPILSARIEGLNPGDEQIVDIYALFTEEVLSITEGAKLVAELKADYNLGGVITTDIAPLTLETWHRNAMTWDDDRKIAAFVTPRDEEIQKVARNTASIVRDEGLISFSSEFQLAMAMLGVMDVFGCAYVIDPKSSYSDLSADTTAVDSIQFPRQTLQYRAGDCDDLSTTYNALLEAVGVETAFITVPGHIYSAYKLNMNVAEAERNFSRSHDLIFLDDEVWVPIETTALSEGFMSAWALGGRQWREHDADGTAQLLRVSDAWGIYEPVAFGVSKYELEIPDRIEVSYLFTNELDDFIDSEISSRERRLLARIESDPDDKRSVNSLGVLYARYGRIEEAKILFESANPETSAMVNLGNLAYLDSRMQEARQLYKQVLQGNPEYPPALLGLAKVEYSEENYDEAKTTFDRLTEISPTLADRYSYLGTPENEVTRASSALVLSQSVAWDE